MAAGSRAFVLEYEYVEVPDAQERLRKAFAILLAAGRRHRREREAEEAERQGESGSDGTVASS